MVNNTCIFCSEINREESVEHIIPRTLGNIHYILGKGEVCRQCNNRLGLEEQKVLSSKVFLLERKKYGLIQKKMQATFDHPPLHSMQMFMLKMGYEALYNSKRKIWKDHDFTVLLEFITRGKSNDLFLEEPSQDNGWKPIPGWMDRFRLRNSHLSLDYLIVEEKLFFRFQFGVIRSTIRLS